MKLRWFLLTLAVCCPVLPVFGQATADQPFQIQKDRVVEGDKTAVAVSPTVLRSNWSGQDREWKLSTDLKGLPVFKAPGLPLLETLYNLSLEEALKDIGNNFFMAGEKWPGTWTRDISYSIHLSLGALFPEASKKSLLFKVTNDPAIKTEVKQDTGTGGSWPVSTDRVVWALAAWETWVSTGDTAWLKTAYDILKATADRDRLAAFDSATGLYFGETTFMDWRAQTYPEWMQPADIYEAKAFGTNLLHWQLNQILAWMGKELAKPVAEVQTWQTRADTLKAAIGKQFWLADKGWFSLYQYPATMASALSDKADSLGNALAVITGLVDPAQGSALLTKLPVVPYGPPIIYPQQRHARYYHNKAVWPFVTAYYGWAGTVTGNEAAASHALAANLRSAALYLTNKENYAYDDGNENRTVINSNRQLWSVAGQLAGIYRGLLGLTPTKDGLRFQPLVPAWVKSDLVLTGYPYRGAKIDLTVQGTGKTIQSLKVDGVEKGAGYVVPADAKGTVKIVLVLDGKPAGGKINFVSTDDISPYDVFSDNVEVTAKGARLFWDFQDGTTAIQIFKNGQLAATVKAPAKEWLDPKPGFFASYSLRTVGERGLVGNLSGPLLVGQPIKIDATTGQYGKDRLMNDPDQYVGEAKGLVWLEKDDPVNLVLKAQVPKAGKYLVRWSYANANGPIETFAKCALRTLWLDGKTVGTLVMPQRGQDWTDFGYTNSFVLNLSAGSHEFKLTFGPENTNMDGDVNQAAVDWLELWPQN